MAKLTAVLILVTFLVCSATLVHAARPMFATSHNEDKKTEEVVKVEDVESCQGLNEEDCLIRRTLVAHTDYIYTQHHNP